jgi:DNA-binding MarR family transcriptional regulator
MLAIKGLPNGTRPTVTALSEQLCLKHHSTVELVNRLVKRGAAVRRQSAEDRREVLVDLTPLGEEILEQLAALHSDELRESGPALSAALQAIAASAASAE